MKKFFIKLLLQYFRWAAKIQLAKIKPRIIALTGSVGKSSLRQAVFAVLKDSFKIKQSIKANSETGLPLDILNLYPQNYSLLDWLRLGLLIPLKLLTDWNKYDYYIAELGVNDPFPPKNMGYLLSFLKPDIGIFLNVAPVHTQQFEKIIPSKKRFKNLFSRQNFLLKAISREKGKILTFLEADKIGVANFDDLLVQKQANQSQARIYYFGRKVKGKNKTELKIINHQISLTGTRIEYQYQSQKFQLKFNYFFPAYYSYTLAAALLTGLALGVSLKQAKTSLAKNFILPKGRMSFFQGIKKTAIIDSSYNASKVSTLGALDLLAKIGKARTKIFVFGDMRELGGQAKEEHRQVGQKLLTIVDKLVLIGPLTKKYVLAMALNKIPVYWFRDSWQAAHWLKNNLQGKEIILVKGSQNTIFTEIVTESLLADKKDKNKLCRRGKFWDKQREKVEV